MKKTLTLKKIELKTRRKRLLNSLIIFYCKRKIYIGIEAYNLEEKSVKQLANLQSMIVA
jgi:hypothetical protein